MAERDESAAGERGPLECPRCATRHPLDMSFCPECGTPLTYAGGGEAPADGPDDPASKVKPEYTGGEPVKAAWANNQAEAELIQGLLLEYGIPSMVKRQAGFDVPDFLAAGPRDILVPESALDDAKAVLADAQEG